MDNTISIRAFLSWQRQRNFCVKCLVAHGSFGLRYDDVLQSSLLAMWHHPNALTAVFETCAVCGRQAVCMAFPGRVVGKDENRRALGLLAYERMALAA